MNSTNNNGHSDIIPESVISIPSQQIEMKNYNKRDHSHCWEKENPPCGVKGTHRCCLCLEPSPQPEEEWSECNPCFDGEHKECVSSGCECPCKPRDIKEWQKTFLDAGTYETGTDLSCMIETVSKILSTEIRKAEERTEERIRNEYGDTRD